MTDSRTTDACVITGRDDERVKATGRAGPARADRTLAEGSFERLSAAEEVALAKRSERGDLQARARLVESHLPLVAAIAHAHAPRAGSLAIDDLVQEGALGLLRAAERFDYRKGFRFSTFARWPVEAAVRRAIDMQARIVRLPSNVLEDLRYAGRVERELTAVRGRAPDRSEILAELPDATRQRIEHAQAVRDIASLEALTGSWPDQHHSETDLSPYESARRNEYQEAVRELLLNLPYRERRILEMRNVPLTLAQVAAQMHLSRERVRQLEERGREKLLELCVMRGIGPPDE